MEIENKKRKIEFWDEHIDLFTALTGRHAGKPISGKVEASVKITMDSSIALQTRSKSMWTFLLEDALIQKGIIKKANQIQTLTIDTTPGDTPGISFFMQEVE